MQNIFYEVNSLDRRCYEQYHLSEDILMEHAANNMALFIQQNYAHLKSILIVCAGGNNGADGIALARLLQESFDIKLYLHVTPSSNLAKLQYKRINSLDINCITDIEPCDIIVDALFGSGFSRGFDTQTSALLTTINNYNAIKIACDIPSGISADGQFQPETFNADITLTMGSLKHSLFGDLVKDKVGEIQVLNLGVSRKMYEKESDYKLLENSDIKLPFRDMQNSHKGSYGHLALLCGEKIGASILSAKAALRFGSGLVTLISNENVNIPYELMLSHTTPATTSAIALGMGMGNEFSQNELFEILDKDVPLLLDADIFYNPFILELLKRKNSVITPHPKEFIALLKRCAIADISIDELQHHRFKYVELFIENYPHVTLVLKGSNVIIAQEGKIFINPHGTNILAKGGSGDVLSGLIGSLLAQGYNPLDAAISGSLTHTLAAKQLTCNNYALSPEDLILALATITIST